MYGQIRTSGNTGKIVASCHTFFFLNLKLFPGKSRIWEGKFPQFLPWICACNSQDVFSKIRLFKEFILLATVKSEKAESFVLLVYNLGRIKKKKKKKTKKKEADRHLFYDTHCQKVKMNSKPTLILCCCYKFAISRNYY